MHVCDTRLDSANCVLDTFSTSRIERRSGGWFVCWKDYRGRAVAKRWQCRGQDFYPVWHRKWPGGGTASTALSQLIRWLRKQPVLPLATWRYWASDKCKLLPITAVDAMQDAGYPEISECVLCGEPLEERLDWWHLDGISGPCCGWTSGCRQKDHRGTIRNYRIVQPCRQS
jgi:hypothetical protein